MHHAKWSAPSTAIKNDKPPPAIGDIVLSYLPWIGRGVDMDFSKHLILYSGGADSTYLIAENDTAIHLLHFEGYNKYKTKVAISNSLLFNRRMDILHRPGHGMDGEVSDYQALLDAGLILDASIRAVTYGLKGIVVGFNQNDMGVDIDSISKIVRRLEPSFEILCPLNKITASDIREYLKQKKIPYASCIIDNNCGVCPKCKRGY